MMMGETQEILVVLGVVVGQSVEIIIVDITSIVMTKIQSQGEKQEVVEVINLIKLTEMTKSVIMTEQDKMIAVIQMKGDIRMTEVSLAVGAVQVVDEVNLVVMAEMTVKIVEMIDRTQDRIIALMAPESPIQNAFTRIKMQMNLVTAVTVEIKEVTVVVIVVEGVPEEVEVTGVKIINLTYQAAIQIYHVQNS